MIHERSSLAASPTRADRLLVQPPRALGSVAVQLARRLLAPLVLVVARLRRIRILTPRASGAQVASTEQDVTNVQSLQGHALSTYNFALAEDRFRRLSTYHFALAEDRFRRAIAVLSGVGSPHLRATLHHELAAMLYAQSKNDEEAEHHAREALELRWDKTSRLAGDDRWLLARIRERRPSRRS
jgi:hypothetical protein